MTISQRILEYVCLFGHGSATIPQFQREFNCSRSSVVSSLATLRARGQVVACGMTQPPMGPPCVLWGRV